MKKIRKILATLLAAVIFIMPQGATLVNAAETPGQTASRYIRAIINKIAEDYRFDADKDAMYEAVLDYVMNMDPTLLEGSIKAVTDTLDPHSDYFTQEELEQFVNVVEKAYVGIGVTIERVPEGIKIVEVNPEGGAFDAGMQIGDVIFQVEGQGIVGLELDEASALIQGDEGTMVNLKVHRGDADVELSVQRRRVLAETVGYTVEDNGIGYIYISKFALSTPESVEKALADIEGQGIKKLIIDVRDNPGGDLSSVIDILSLFVPKDTVLTKIEYNDERFSTELKSNAKFKKAPDRKMVVLVNENSASAAELFAGAMQNLGLAKVVGATTYGKGSMQEFMRLINPPGFQLGDIKLSVAEFTKPDGSKINGLGIEPDVRVKNVYEPYDASGLTPMTINDRYSVGAKAEDVRAIEERLTVLGYYTGNVDDTFDSFTASATEKFQSDLGLYAYGVMDYTTQNALNNEIDKVEVEIDRQFDAACELLLKE